MVAAGVLAGGEALLPSAMASTIQVREGNKIVEPGPYAKEAEQISGFYLLDCKTQAEAEEWAAQCPDAKTGKIEVRPVLSIEKPQ